jgi:ABC-type transport system substrate-binding protein
MLEAAAATIDRAKRVDLYKQIQQRVLRDAVCVPLVDTITYNAKRAEVSGDAIDALASYVWMYDVQVRR